MLAKDVSQPLFFRFFFLQQAAPVPPCAARTRLIKPMPSPMSKNRSGGICDCGAMGGRVGVDGAGRLVSRASPDFMQPSPARCPFGSTPSPAAPWAPPHPG